MNPPPNRPPAPADAAGTGDTVARASGSDTGSPLPPAPTGPTDPAVLGDFVVLRKIGEGGMGAVYLAEDRKLGRRAAVKTMKRELAADKTNRDRFAREARAAAAVESDYIVPVWQIGEAADGTPYIAMPFLQGEMLDARLKREGATSVALVLKVALEVGHGLAAAHAAGLIHRDIKPGNIWLEGDPAAREPARQVRRCKILDFGLARSAGPDGPDDTNVTASGAILGTPAYMAPEQARGERVDFRADLFSLGVTLYRMATGRVPFQGPNAMAVLIALTTETHEPVAQLAPHLPPALAALIERLMCKNPAERPASAAEVASAVKRLVREHQGRVPSGSADVSSSLPVVVLPAPVAPDANPWENVTEVAPAPRDDALSGTARGAAGGGRVPWRVVGGAAAAAAVAVVLLVVALRGATADGTAALEFADPQAEARLKSVQLIGPDGKAKYALTPGERTKRVEAGRYAVRVDGPDGLAADAREVTLKPGESVSVRLHFAEPKPVAKKEPKKKDDPVPADPDRRAAEYVFSVGGAVRVDDGTQHLRAPTELPAGAFRLTGAYLNGNQQVRDAGLVAFRGCKHLKVLDLGRTGVTLAGSTSFRECTELTDLYLGDTQVGDTGLAQFRECKRLKNLDLSGTLAGDPGVAFFAGCEQLTALWLHGTGVGDAGMEAFKDCAQLGTLSLGETRVTDEGLAHFKGCKLVHYLSLLSRPITDAGLAHFKGCKLTHLNLFFTRAGDAGIELFKGSKDLLTFFNVAGTRVTDAGLAHFDGCANLTFLNLSGSGATAAGVSHFRNNARLVTLWLNDLPLTDAVLEPFGACLSLRDLSVQRTPVGDAGLAHFKRCKALRELLLNGTRVTDTGLGHVAGCDQLAKLQLGGTRVTRAGIALFREHTLLTELYLDRTALGDEAVPDLKAFRALARLNLSQTKVTAEGATALRKALPACEIMGGGTP